MDLGALGDGSSVPQINNGDIEPLVVPLPPLEEQAEIVRRLCSAFAFLDSVRANMARATLKREQLERAVLSKAFSGELVGALTEACVD